MGRRSLPLGLLALALLSSCGGPSPSASSPAAGFAIRGYTSKLRVGGKITLGVQGAEARDLTYESSDEGVLTVDSRGVVSAKGEGTATVTASCGAGSSSFSFEVAEAPSGVPEMLDAVWGRNYSITYQTGATAHYLSQTAYCRIEGSDLSSFTGYAENLDQGMAELAYVDGHLQPVSFLSGAPGMNIADVLGEDVAALAKNPSLWSPYQGATYSTNAEELVSRFLSLMGMSTYSAYVQEIYAEPDGHDLAIYCLLNGQRQGFTYEDVGVSHYGLLERYLAFPQRAAAREAWSSFDEKAFLEAGIAPGDVPFVRGSSYALSVSGARKGFTLKDVVSGDLRESYEEALLSLDYEDDGEEDTHLGYLEHHYHLTKIAASPTSGSLTYRVSVRYIEPEYLDAKKKPYCPSGSFEVQFSREEIPFQKEGASEAELNAYLEANAPGKFPATEFGEKATSFLLEDMTQAANERIQMQIDAGISTEADLYHFAFYATVSVASLDEARQLIAAYEAKLAAAGYSQSARHSDGDYHVFLTEEGEEVDTSVHYEEDGATYSGSFGVFFGD